MNTQLITQIARCNEVEKAKTDNHPCSKIVCSQINNDFQLPEPWNGDISNAKILFVSSNPSIDPKANQDGHESYPTEKYSNEDLPEFFRTRFDKYTHFSGSKQKYWFYANKCVGWILGKESRGVNLLRDHAALTEVVHCKSESEKHGVKECSCLCAQKWLDKVLAEFNGDYIVVVGNIAKACMREQKIGDKKIAFIPSHQAHGYTDEQRKAILLEQLQ